MCSHEIITWEITKNTVRNRMIDNSFTHKFKPSWKIRRRTKVLNSEIKKHYVIKDYKHYVELKTNVLRNLANDDTDESSNLTDVDYGVIYSSPSKQAKYVAENSEKYISTSEEDDERNINYQMASRDRSRKRKIQTRTSPRLKHTTASKNIDIDIDRQEMKNNISDLQVHRNIVNNEKNISKNIFYDSNSFNVQSNKRSLSSQFDSQNSTTKIMKYNSEYTRHDRESNTMDNNLRFENSTISNKTKAVGKDTEKKIPNHKNQSATMNKSNTKFNLSSTHQSSLSRSTTLKNNDFNNESNTFKSKDNNSNKLTAINNENLINTHNHTHVSHKPELLKNVKRNLISVLEEINLTNNNKAIERDKNVDDRLSNDKVVSAATSFNHSTPLKETNILQKTLLGKNLLPEIVTLPLDQQKDSGIDEDLEDKFVNNKKSNELATSCNMKENAEKTFTISSELKENNEVIEIAENCDKTENDVYLKFNNVVSLKVLRDQIKEESKFFGKEKMKTSSQSNQIHINVEINRNKEKRKDKKEENEHFVKTENSNDIQKQQLLSPEQNYVTDAHSESHNCIREKEDDKKIKKSSKEEETSLQLSKVYKGTEVSSINRECKTRIIELEHSYDIQKQLLLPEKNHVKDPKSSNNILSKDKRQANEEKKEKYFSQLNEADKDTKTHVINQESKTCAKLENTCNVQEQQISSEVICTEIFNKKYKILNNYTSTKKKMLIHCPDVMDHNINNWQEATKNVEKIDTSITETDNEEINMNSVSPQNKKRLQQARLNLVVSSDSDESDNVYVTPKTSRKLIDNISITSAEDNRLKNNKTNCTSETNILHGKDTYKEASLASTEVTELNSTNVDEIKEKAESLTSYTDKSNDLFQSTTHENPLQESQYCENVPDDDESEDSFQLTVSEDDDDDDVSYNNKKSINQSRHKQSLSLNEKNMYIKNEENEEIMRANLERYKFEHEQSAQASIKSHSNAHLNISCQSRPYNLQELVEDQELLVETMPASFTLADLSENEEAFILNVPNKVVQCNLKDQQLTLKEKSIKFNESTYRIVHKEVDTTSCIFATGKKRKPYKIMNIKKISNITVQDKLPRDSRKADKSNSRSAGSKLIKINRQINEADSEMLKNYKHKREEIHEKQ